MSSDIDTTDFLISASHTDLNGYIVIYFNTTVVNYQVFIHKDRFKEFEALEGLRLYTEYPNEDPTKYFEFVNINVSENTEYQLSISKLYVHSEGNLNNRNQMLNILRSVVLGMGNIVKNLRIDRVCTMLVRYDFNELRDKLKLQNDIDSTKCIAKNSVKIANLVDIQLAEYIKKFKPDYSVISDVIHSDYNDRIQEISEAIKETNLQNDLVEHDKLNVLHSRQDRLAKLIFNNLLHLVRTIQLDFNNINIPNFVRGYNLLSLETSVVYSCIAFNNYLRYYPLHSFRLDFVDGNYIEKYSPLNVKTRITLGDVDNDAKFNLAVRLGTPTKMNYIIFKFNKANPRQIEFLHMLRKINGNKRESSLILKEKLLELVMTELSKTFL